MQATGEKFGLGPFNWRTYDMWKHINNFLIIVVATAMPLIAHANLLRTFDSYHAFFVYADDSNKPVDQQLRDIFKNDAYAMRDIFANAGWSTGVYGWADGTSLLDAMNDISVVAQPNELIYFFYSGHGGGYYADKYGKQALDDGKPDTNSDENDIEDPLPPLVPVDIIDETLAYGPNANDFIADDDLGAFFDSIQSTSAWISGALDSCHSNGMLDGSSDIRGFENKESVWFTSVTEWQRAPGCSPGSGYGSITDFMLHTVDLTSGLDQIGDLLSWYWNAADFGLSNNLIDLDSQTMGIKIYEEDGASHKYYIPEPNILVLLGLGMSMLIFLKNRAKLTKS